MSLLHESIRLARVGLAVAALLAAGAANALAAPTNDGLNPPPVVPLFGSTNPSVLTAVHNSRDFVVTSSPAGVSIHPWVQVSGGSGTPTGGIAVHRWNNATCAGLEAGSQSALLVNGVVNFSTFTVTPTESGSISYQAYYTGDPVYKEKTGVCTAVTITKVNPAVVIRMRNVDNDFITTAYLGMDIHAFVDVTGSVDTATGTVRIYQWNGGSCSGAASVVGPYTLAGGSVNTPYQWGMDTLGTFAFRATYQGDGTYNAVSSPCLVIQVTKWPVNFHTELHNRFEAVVTSTSVGETVHAAVTLSGQLGTPVGQVSVKHYLTGDCTGSPNVDITIPAAAVIDPAGPELYSNELPGQYSWRLAYLGNTFYAAETGPCLKLIRKSTPVVQLTVHNASHAAVTSVTLGKTVHLKVSAIGNFDTTTGDVNAKWYANGTCTGTAKSLGTRTLVNAAIDDTTLALKPTKTGTYSFKAFYLGDASYFKYDSPCVTLKVVAAPVVTPAPTAIPAATAAPQPSPEASAAPSPAASEAPATAAPETSPVPNPTGDDIPATDAPAATAAPAATDGPVPTQPGVTSPSGDGGPGLSWVLLLGLLLLILLGAGYAVSRRRRPPRKA